MSNNLFCFLITYFSKCLLHNSGENHIKIRSLLIACENLSQTLDFADFGNKHACSRSKSKMIAKIAINAKRHLSHIFQSKAKTLFARPTQSTVGQNGGAAVNTIQSAQGTTTTSNLTEDSRAKTSK